MAIHIYGTSHVSEDSLDLIEEKIDEHDPEVIALELDMARLNALLAEDIRSGGPMFIRLIKKFQEHIGSKTGVMPGEEMLFAYEKAIEEEREIALIDQDITTTVEQLKDVRILEKIKALAQLTVALVIPGSFDFTEIPDQEFLDQLLFEFSFKFPEMYQVLVEDRNRYMADALRKVQSQNPDSDIVAFVGAAHKKGIEEKLAKTL